MHHRQTKYKTASSQQARRQPRFPRATPLAILPRLWLFTDERVADDALLSAIAALPRGSGIVFRHYRRAPALRRALYNKVKTLTRRRGFLLLLGGTVRDAARWRADGAHIPNHVTRASRAADVNRLHSASAHNAAEMATAIRNGARLIFLSPIFATRSHPESGRPLGPLRFGLMTRQTRIPVIALGGMTATRFAQVQRLGAYGWGAIDAFTPKQS